MDCPVLLRIVVLLSFPFCIRPARFQWQSSASASPSPSLSPSCYISIGQPAHSSLTRSLCITFRKLASPSSSPLHYTVTYATHKPSLPPSPSPSPLTRSLLTRSLCITFTSLCITFRKFASSSSSSSPLHYTVTYATHKPSLPPSPSLSPSPIFSGSPSSSSPSPSPVSSPSPIISGSSDEYPSDEYPSSDGSPSSGIGIPVIVVIVVSVVIFIVIFICVCRKVCKKASPNNNGNDLQVGMGIRAYTTEQRGNNNGNDLEAGMGMGIRAYTTDQQRGNSLEGLVTYTLEDLVRATNNFKTKIGQGASGFVYLANFPDGRMGAVKRAKDLDLKSFKEELSVLLRLPRHPHLVDLIGWCVQPGSCGSHRMDLIGWCVQVIQRRIIYEKILVFEFICNGNLYDRLHKNKGGTSPLSWAARMDIASQLALALQYLHEEAKPPILHRDIKSANVLLVNDNCVKLADFGLAKLGRKDNQSTFTAVRGSYGYMDPQYVKTRKYSAKSDVYSFGVLLLELITGLKSVHDDTPLAEWTETYRSQGIQRFMTIVDQNMIADHIDIMELQNVMMIANRCLREISKERPAMIEIVNMMQRTTNLINSSGNLSVDGVEAPFML